MVQKRNYFIMRPLFSLTILIALLSWLFVFAQVISSIPLLPSQKVIPAFQITAPVKTPLRSEPINTKIEWINENTVRIPISYIQNLKTKKNFFSSLQAQSSGSPLNKNKEEIYTFFNQYDKEIQLLSFQQEKNYADYYFYSPRLEHDTENSKKYLLQKILTKKPDTSLQDFNMQVVITKKYLYLGIPSVQYDF